MPDDRVSPLSDYQIMLIRPQQALLLARNDRKLLISYEKKGGGKGILGSLRELYSEKRRQFIYQPFFKDIILDWL